MRSLRLFVDLILQASLWPWGRLRHLKEMYTRDISLGVGGYRRPEVCRADNLTTFMCWLSVRSGRHNLLEPQRPVQVCNGITLLLRTFRKTDHGMNEWMKWMCACVCYACKCTYVCTVWMLSLNKYLYDKVTVQHSCRFSARCHFNYETNLKELHIINTWSGSARRDWYLVFISTNNSQCFWNDSVGSIDPAESFQEHIQQTIHKCNTIIDKNKHKHLIQMKPITPKLTALIRTHKEDKPNRPAINNTQASSYKHAKHLNEKVDQLINLPYTCAIKTLKE
jgi:hypothetical protein